MKKLTEDHILYDSINTKCPEQAIEPEADQCLFRMRGWEKRRMRTDKYMETDQCLFRDERIGKKTVIALGCGVSY